MQFVLIVTHGRSGSTLLQGILNAIEGWHIKGENFNFAYGLYQSTKALSDTQGKGCDAVSSPQQPWFGSQLFDPKAYEGKAGELLRETISAGVDLEQVKCLGFKEIRYLEVLNTDPSGASLNAYLEFLKRALAPCKIIFLTRTPEEAAKSGWWAKNKKTNVIEALERFGVFCAAAASGDPDGSFILSYDDMVNRTPRLDELFGFLGDGPSGDALQAVLSTPHSYAHTSIYPLAVPTVKDPSKRKYKELNHADRLQFNGKFGEARQAYQAYVKGQLDSDNEKFPFYAAGRSGLPVYRVRTMKKFRALYVPLPKCGCTSVSSALFQADHGRTFDDDEQSIHNYFYPSDRVAASLQAYSDHFKFTVVRDPIERFVSGYRNRIIHHNDLKLKNQPSEHGPKSINWFARNLRRTIATNLTVAIHFWPLSGRLGNDLSQLDRIYPVNSLGDLQDDFRVHFNTELHLERLEVGGPKMSLADLEEDAFEFLLDFYAEDYALLSDYYTLDRIREKYSSARERQ